MHTLWDAHLMRRGELADLADFVHCRDHLCFPGRTPSEHGPHAFGASQQHAQLESAGVRC